MTRDAQRERVILARRAAGETLASIGRSLGVSRERIRQIVKRNKPATPAAQEAPCAK